MRIFHIARAADWEQARRSGSYTVSSYGRTLQQEGFIHASRREQVRAVFDRFYRDVPDRLVLLAIDTDLLTAPWVDEPVGTEVFPHIHGPLNTSAVVGVARLDRNGEIEAFGVDFAREVVKRVLVIAAVLFVLAVAALVLAGTLGG
jgi:uncharacterized protein (DUF952 family)